MATNMLFFQLLILDTLHRCVRINTLQALASDGMAVYTSLLKHSTKEIRAKAAMDIKELRYNKNLNILNFKILKSSLINYLRKASKHSK